VKDIKMTEICT